MMTQGVGSIQVPAPSFLLILPPKQDIGSERTVTVNDRMTIRSLPQ
jgi:hypothetical protein